MNSFYQEPKHTIYCGHALDILKEMPNESVDMVITSPPYWGLRTYKTEPIIWGENHCAHEWGFDLISKANDSNRGTMQWVTGGNPAAKVLGQRVSQGNFCLKCNAWRGELGLEPTIELYIQHLIRIFNEVKRVLKKTGTCWVNIDDSYAGGKGQSGCGDAEYQSNRTGATLNKPYHQMGGPGLTRPADGNIGIPAKSLCLIPQRFAIAMVENGWILRNDIVWNKPNPMPESVKDRFTGSWEHLFFFVKNRTYYFEQQFEGLSPLTLADSRNDTGRHTYSDSKWTEVEDKPSWYRAKTFVNSELGRNKRDVWEINTQPYPEAHFATFPENLCETPILAGCPSMICKKCGKAREKVYEFETIWRKRPNEFTAYRDINGQPSQLKEGAVPIDKGYTDCGCKQITCNVCGNVLYYTREELKDATQRYRETQGVPEKLGAESLPEHEAVWGNDSGDMLLQREDMPALPETILRQEGSGVLQSQMCGTNGGDRRETQYISEGQALTQLQRGNNKQSRIQDGYSQREGNTRTSADNANPSGEGANSRRGSSSSERDKDRQSSGKSRTRNQENAQRASNLPSLPNPVQSQIACPKCHSPNLAIQSVAFEPGVVLDPFVGSGTAQAVAKRLGRKSIGIELNPDYCKLAAKRLQEIPMAMELV